MARLDGASESLPRVGRSRPCSPRTGISTAALAFALVVAGCKGGTDGPGATSLDPPAEPDPPGDVPAFPFVAHVDQVRITSGAILFDELFVLGDEFFEAEFNSLDGAGALLLPDGTPLPSRFSRVPPGGGRFTGPNAQACSACHNAPLPTSAGEAASNVAQDPSGTGMPPFNRRNPISLFGSGVIQRLAEEITEDLLALKSAAELDAVPGGAPVSRRLTSKGIDFGEISVTRALDGTVDLDASGVEGIDPDLVVRPFGWKGNATTLRDFVRGASRNELGMEADELVARDALGRDDPDGDGIVGEFSVGDITALTIYCAAQEVPTTTARLAREGFAAPPPAETAVAIARGRELFELIGCAECHVPALTLRVPTFEEPTTRGGGKFFDTTIDPIATGLDPARPFRFDLVREGDAPRLELDREGRAVAKVFGDFKRHRMGRALADAQPTAVTTADGDPLEIDGAFVDVPADTFFTPELWGVGNTGPWLHDGRAASLDEAIALHGEDSPPPVGDADRSEAQESRDAFLALDDDDRAAVVEFLKSLVLASFEVEE